MKHFISSSIFLFVFIFSFINSKAQIAGNAVAGNHIYNSNSEYLGKSGMVNLNLDAPYQNQFSRQLEANVMMNVKAGSYVAIFSLSQHGKTLEEAEQAMTLRMDIFQESLKMAGLTPDKLFVDPVSMVPVYSTELIEKRLSRTYNEVPSGFEMKKTLHITFSDHSMINKIISIAAKAEVYDLVKVDYSIENMDQTLDLLRDQALRILLSKKKSIEKAGISLKLNQVGEKYSSAYPFERYAQYYAYKTGTPPSIINSSKKTQGQQVNFNYAEKSKTVYYEKISDKQFDLIINPVVGEPMVQVYLTLKATYNTYDPAQEEQDKKHNEKLRQLQLRELELNLLLKEKELLSPKKQTGVKGVG